MSAPLFIRRDERSSAWERRSSAGEAWGGVRSTLSLSTLAFASSVLPEWDDGIDFGNPIHEGINFPSLSCAHSHSPHIRPFVHAGALFIQDALFLTTHSRPLPGRRCRNLHLAHLMLVPYVHLTLIVQVLISFFELPAWCATTPECKASLDRGRLTGATQQQQNNKTRTPDGRVRPTPWTSP